MRQRGVDRITFNVLRPVASVISPFWALANTAARRLWLPGAKKLPRPVISVGNIVAGGVGKTELVIWLARALTQRGKQVVVASRGYGSAWEKQGGVAHDLASAASLKFPDEAQVLLKKAPGTKVAVGADRTQVLTRHWEELAADVVLLDDGFQHFKIARDLDILVHDFSTPWPILRELPSVLNKVRVRVSLSEVPKMWSKLDWVKARYRLEGAVDAADRAQPLPRRALVFCGIGNPIRFRRSLEQAGVEVVGMKTYRDHYRYGAEDARHLLAWRKAKGDLPLLTTLKDYVKLLPLLGSQGGVADFEPLWVNAALEIVEGEAILWKAVDQVMESHK